MKRVALVPLLVLLWLGLGAAQVKSDQGYSLQLLQADETGVVVELRLAHFSLAERRRYGVLYQTIVAPGLVSLTEPGQPQLPSLGFLLGTPPAGVAQIKILKAEFETLNGLHLSPTPDLTITAGGEQVETFSLASTVYSHDAFWPGSLAEVGLSGYLRQQAVAQLRLFPFQYNPVSQTLQVYRRLQVQVVFAAPVATQPDRLLSPPQTPYEQLLRTALINYDSLPASFPVPPEANPAKIGPQALKIFVDEAGLYQVTYEALQSAGFNLSDLDPHRLQLTSGGLAVPIYIYGEADGVFNPGDWLEFYGAAQPNPFTTRNVYWLTVGAEPGLRMAEWNGLPANSTPPPTAFYTTLHLEENHEYWPLLPDGTGRDHWFWIRFPPAPYSYDFSFDLPHLAATPANGLARVDLQGRTTTATSPDHHTQIFLNGVLIHQAWWDGDAPFTHEITVPMSYFQEGSNLLTVTTPGDTGAALDSIYVDGFDIGYWQPYLAENDQLYFTSPQPGTNTFVVSNFTRPDIQVYDLTDPAQVRRLLNGVIEADETGYGIRFEDNAAPTTRYLALTTTQKRAPAGLELDIPSTWKSSNQGADYVLISHDDFAEAMAPLAAVRAGQGLRVATVQITDIYDEFSHGVFDPQAIRDFLSYAYHHWSPPAPLYVLLVGDANYDYHDYLATGHPNYLPTHLFESSIIGQTLSDNWFVSVSGDDPLPDMFIGRLPVKSSAEASLAVNKILAYEQNPTPADWQQKALFVADDDEAIFEVVSDEQIAQLPPNYSAQRIYASAYPQPYDPTSDIINAIDQGALIVNYVGHGNVATWGNWSNQNMLRTEDLPLLNNGYRSPFLITANCSNGFFAHPTQDALAETFVQLEGRGGIAAWSPAGLGFTAWHWTMISALYRAMFDQGRYQLGAATTAAKIEAFAQLGGWNEPIEIFTLLGDPALTLQIIPPGLDLHNMAAPQVQPGQFLTHTLTYRNDSLEPAQNVVLEETYDTRTSYHAAEPPPTNGNNVWEIGSLPAGASGAVTVTLLVPETTPKGVTLVNKAILTSNNFDSKSAVAKVFVGDLVYLPLIFQNLSP